MQYAIQKLERNNHLTARLTVHRKKQFRLLCGQLILIFSTVLNFNTRHGKFFVGRPCKRRADDLLKLSRLQLKMVIAILTGHPPVREHLYIMDVFEGDPTCRFCRKETETVQYILCCCEALALQRYVFGNPFV
jgi:hypothetical protein